MTDTNVGRAARALAAAGGLVLVGAAAGQANYWFFELKYSDPAGVIDSPDDFVTVNLWAAFDRKYYAFEGAELNFITADDPRDAGLWLNPQALLNGPGYLDGTVEGESVVGVITWQIYFPKRGSMRIGRTRSGYGPRNGGRTTCTPGRWRCPPIY